MTVEEAIEACVKHKLIVNFCDIIGHIEVQKFGHRWCGPDDISGYGEWGEHRVSRAKTFVKAVEQAVERLPQMRFKEDQ